ncbi:MAG: inositol monophosphatase family protein [Jaaginema sp. PMC 1079.18]|nr:inositol monophosphatase family protein [Jaaginema sp. PMC 1080.18]MEC4850346.1 inositol monophosphatase family protein [Jaaginema sp. PMC 1079.18]MEC4867144.1 inositol monophosphatase family protein [Jaaginema sp. PMC 1078.18]
MSDRPQQNYLDIATAAALAAGQVLQDRWGKINNIQEKGRGGDLVTEVDKASEAVLLEVLQRHLPDHAILAEESGEINTSHDNPYLWAIDPLDGTTNYAHGYPVACVSVGLLIDGQPTVGVVYNPLQQELFRAAKGCGATLNYRPIQVSQTNELSRSLLATGFAYDRRETADNNYAEFCYLTHQTQGVRRAGAAAMDLVAVACGRYDGYWERGIKPWDVAAGIVILEEAGGKVTAYDRSPLDLASGRILATNSYLHDSLSHALQNVPPLSQWPI